MIFMSRPKKYIKKTGLSDLLLASKQDPPCPGVKKVSKDGALGTEISSTEVAEMINSRLPDKCKVS